MSWGGKILNETTFIIVDVDGTILSRILDNPIKYSKETLWIIKERENALIVYVTGRILDPTETIKDAGFPCDLVIYRKFGNKFTSFFTPIIEYKRLTVELLKELNLKPLIAFENSDDMIRMYEENGIPTYKIEGPESWKRFLLAYVVPQ